MPIKFLDERFRMQRLGRIRLGHKEKKTRKDGSTVEYPVADPFFVLPEELMEACGTEPTTLRIRFIADSLEWTFPHYLRRYTKAGLRCLGDGETVIYRVDEDGDVVARNYNMVTAEGKVVMAGEVIKRLECLGDQCAYYLSGECKPTGFLRFVVEERLRQGYYDLVCHQRAVVGIKTQLMLCLQMFGRLTDIPFLLHRGEPEPIPVRVPDKGMVDMPVRIPWIEIDPDWFQRNFVQRRAVLVESTRLRQLQAAQDIEDLYGPEEAEQVLGDFAEAVYNGEGEDTVDVEAGPEPEELPEETEVGQEQEDEQFIQAVKVREELQEAAGKFKQDRVPTEGQLGLLAGKMAEAILDNDDKPRHLILRWLWGEESSKALAYGAIGAMLRRWVSSKADSGGDYPLRDGAAQELLLLLRVAQKEAGQLEMELIKA